MKSLFFAFAFLFSSTFCSAQLGYGIENLSGVWVIEFEPDANGETDLDPDTLIIKHTESGITAICTSYIYFDVFDIKYDQRSLTFTITNSVDTDELYTMKYQLKPKAGKDPLFVGKFVNQLQEESKLQMQRIAEIPN